jgi:hypothetical protein
MVGFWRVDLARKNDGRLRTLAKRPKRSAEGPSARRINAIAVGMKCCDDYLEIGVAQGLTLEQVRISRRWAVDPHPQFDHRNLPKGVVFEYMESDSFFHQIDTAKKFDLVFLDGLHTWQQTYKDLMNTLNHSHLSSIIVIDDVVPDDALAAIPDWEEALAMKDAVGITDGRWQGDVFKVLLVIRDHHPELDFCVVGENAEGDNPQAIVWKLDPSIEKFDDEKLISFENFYSMVEYDQIFIGGEIPSEFRHMNEEEGINLALRMTQN